jgi:hypothetical protein
MEKITVFELAATLVALFFSIFAFNTVLYKSKDRQMMAQSVIYKVIKSLLIMKLNTSVQW